MLKIKGIKGYCVRIMRSHKKTLIHDINLEIKPYPDYSLSEMKVGACHGFVLVFKAAERVCSAGFI
jgi:hypothetical protein